jgi:hypothetical protein
MSLCGVEIGGALLRSAERDIGKLHIATSGGLRVDVQVLRRGTIRMTWWVLWVFALC